MRTRAPILIALGALALGSCNGGAEEGGVAEIARTPDPILAQTLNDPLMVDPDLVHRSEGNAALSIRHDHALPPHVSTTETAEAARELAMNELLRTGPLADLPLSSGEWAGQALAPGMSAEEIIAVTGAPSRCVGKLTEGLVWAAQMPDAGRVMPHGMTMQAAGAEVDRCKIRIVRYLTPVGVEDALRYHFNRTDRAGMAAKRFSEPDNMLDAARGSEHLRVHARAGPGGMSAVDLIYWRR